VGAAVDKGVIATIKLNLKTIIVPYAITAFVFLFALSLELIKYFSFRAGADIGEQISISVGTFLWLLIPLAAVFIAARNLSRVVNLGGKRKQFFVGSGFSYVILTAAVSLVSTLLTYSYDNLIVNSGMYKGLVNLMEVWGWVTHGPVTAFLQQFAFLLLAAASCHTLTLIQNSWRGWLADLIIATLVLVFITIAPLRDMLHSSLRLLIYHPSALLQIASCIVLAAVLYSLSYPVLSRKNM